MLELKITLNDEFYAQIPMELTLQDYKKANKDGQVKTFCEQFNMQPWELTQEHKDMISCAHRIMTENITLSLGTFDKEGCYVTIPDGECKLELVNNEDDVLWSTTATSSKKQI
jgi:hypothetical protein